MTSYPYETERLLLRRWEKRDLEPFAQLNADPEVMRYFPTPLAPSESDALVTRLEEHFDTHDFGLWALERKAGSVFIGFTGLSQVSFEAPFSPAVEVGWRLARHAWGHGYATEAGARALAIGFENFGLTEIVSFTAAINRRSQAVMSRLGMSRKPEDDFLHPRLPLTSPLSPHVLFRSRALGDSSRRVAESTQVEEPTMLTEQ